GVFKRNNYTGLNWSLVPSVIVEMGYMTHPEEDVKLNSADYQEKLVIGAVKGIAEYLNVTIN
ncbi:MAG: N-acetylmuramoyl-L-alanine amidase, partial [Clostridia bacterium]|nr:N-acetylmuramoyl-L-alanine amidase [Clostridia bacterium]